jgi:hypothetical protein
MSLLLITVDVASVRRVCINFMRRSDAKHNLDTSVSIATDYGLDSRGSIRDKGKIFLYSTASKPPTQPSIQRVPWAHFLGVKRQVREADHSPPSSAHVKNGVAIRSLPHTSSWHDT